MKYQATAICGLVAAFTLSTAAEASTVVFADDFTTSTINNQGNPYVGGWFTPQLSFQKWTGTSESSITSGALNVNTTNSTRSAGIVLSPSLFDGAGDYILTFDLKSYTGDSNDSAVATVWAGKGYDLTKTSGNSITVNTYSASLVASGSALANQLAAVSLHSASNGNQLAFSYDGVSAIAVFLGVNTGGYPFPTATYDNVSISKVEVNTVPEPAFSGLIGVALLTLIVIRRRVS